MDYQQFAADLPPGETIASFSAEENQEIMDRLGVEQRVRQVGGGSFRSDMAVRESEQVTLFADRFSKGCLMYLEPPKGTVGLLVFRSAGEQVLASGAAVANDKMVVLPSESGTDVVIPDLAGSDAITVPESRFIELTEALCPTSRRPTGMAVLGGNTAQLHAMRQAIVHQVALPESQASEEELSNLVAQMIAWAGHSSGKRSEVLATMKARARVAKQAKEYIESHYRDAFRIEGLCLATGVGIRTLQRAFRDYFGVTVSGYLKTVRLDAAHRGLAGADAAQSTVSTIALQQGFTHLGRFSVEFRHRFGESPKDTLAKRADSKVLSSGSRVWRTGSMPDHATI